MNAGDKIGERCCTWKIVVTRVFHEIFINYDIEIATRERARGSSLREVAAMSIDDVLRYRVYQLAARPGECEKKERVDNSRQK